MKYIVMVLAIITLASAGVIHPQLAEKLATLGADEALSVIVHMENRPDLSTMPEASKVEKILYLQIYAEQDQADLIKYLTDLGEKVTIDQTWWIFNGLMFTAPKEIIESVAAREDVYYVIDNFAIPLDPTQPKKVDPSRAPQWNITQVSAHLCWNDGFDGSGVIVGNIDTGVDVTHPAFGGRWLTGGWYDGINGQTSPYDDHGHGTHTMGTICGGDGNGPFDPDIGIAPGANFIAAKG